MMQDGDAVALFNFRSDRMVEISKAFEYEDFNAFDRKRFPKVSPCSKVKFPLVMVLRYNLGWSRTCSCQKRSINS